MYRTDIRGYYRHILKHQVAGQLQWHIADVVCRDLCLQWLHYSIEDGGEIVTPEKGICCGSALSSLIGGSLLRHVDSYFATREEIFYVRYMDDFIFSLKSAGIYARQLSNSINFLIWVALPPSRIKHNWGKLNMALTGWGYGMPPKGPG